MNKKHILDIEGAKDFVGRVPIAGSSAERKSLFAEVRPLTDELSYAVTIGDQPAQHFTRFAEAVATYNE